MLAAFMLIGGLEAFANEIATLTYFSLLIGVLNLIWDNILESRPKLHEISRKSPFYSRILINLLAFSILIYLSRPAISNISAGIYILILIFTLIYMIVREARRNITHRDDRRKNKEKATPRSKESKLEESPDTNAPRKDPN